MRICYISNSASPSKNASSLQTAKLCEYISKKGHTVKLILPNTGVKKNFFRYYNIKSKFTLERVCYFNKFPIGINYYLYSIFAIIKSNLKLQDLYITRNFFTSFVLCILKKKHILEIHDDIEIEGRLIRFLIKNLKTLNSKHLIKIVTTTRTLKKKYTSYNIEKKKIFVLHNASSLSSKFKKCKNKNYYKIGYFGSIFQSRGINMISNLSKLDRKNKYYIFGGTKKQIKLFSYKNKNKNIMFSSYIPYKLVSKTLSKIDICILPYTSKITVSGNVGDISKYTSPLKVFDYMKLGKLIICSNFPVIREVLKNNVNSILIDNFQNEKEWLKVINKVTNNFKKYNHIRKNAFLYANKYNLDWRIDKLLSFNKFSK